MFDVETVAVRSSLDRLRPVLPPPPARIVEAGCGRGALAAALGRLGYQVTGVDPDAEACAAARARGVDVREAGIAEADVGAGQDVVLFTRSLHHAAEPEAALRRAVELLAPGGVVVLEEFAWERTDRAAAGFLFDSQGLLQTAGLLTVPERPFDPWEDPLDRWKRERGVLEGPMHTGADMLAALARAGAVVQVDTGTDTLWRMLAPPGSTWQVDDARAARLVDGVRQVECRRIAEGTLPAVGMLVVARRPAG